ncbi:MAG: CDP-alcohol phosphatidyltransferase family protein [Clostridia bacterium]|nr:CDP-alcohol phosphatidyltransferase family protein [Clostridia bacterium]
MKEFWKYFLKNLKQVINDLKSKDKEKRRKQIPNVLTLIRGIIAPFTIIPAVINQNLVLAFSLIAICALTDSFDGWYARNRDAQSEFGALLDAICDKLFVLTLTFPLVFVYTKWIVGILILELIIAIINTYSKIRGNDPHSSIMGKVKTFALDTSIAICYLNFIVKVPEWILGSFAILAYILQFCSIIGYYKIYKQQVSNNELNKV